MPEAARTAAPPTRSPAPARPPTPALAPTRSASSSSQPSRLQAGPAAVQLNAPAPNPAVIQAASGDPLAPDVRANLERSFGVDLQAVRVHTDERAQNMAHSMAARAFTIGSQIYLGPGERPNDLRLLAHEVAHVVQQRSAPAVQRWSFSGGDRYEHEAQQASAAAVQHQSFTVHERTSPRAQRLLGLDFDPRSYIAGKAAIIPGFTLLTVIIGSNPITGAGVDRSAANILRGVIQLIPVAGAYISQALDNHGIFDQVANWVVQRFEALRDIGTSIVQAIEDFIKGLHLSDLASPGDVWERGKRIFTDPIDRIKNFAASLVDGFLTLIKDLILKPIGKWAKDAAPDAYNLLCAFLGSDPITGEASSLDGEALLSAFMTFVGQDEVLAKMKEANAMPRTVAWFKTTMSELKAFVSEIPGLFITAFQSLTLMDIVTIVGAFAKVAGVFGSFAGRFISWGANAIWKLLEIVFDVVSPGALGYIKRTGDALKSILKNPLPFVGNLVKAAKLGFQNFADNIGTHLKAGLIDWLTGSLSGVYIPKALTLLEFGKFALSVLGVSWAQIRGKIVKALGPNGEMIMQGLETAFDVVKALVTGGPAAAWEVIKDKLTNLKDMLIDGIKSFVIETIVMKAVPKLISMFIPGAGFISAIISIYDTVMVFVQKLAKIIQVVKGFIDSIVAIAAGQIGGAASRVEKTLAGLLSLAISFLAGFLGLGKITDKIMGVVNKVRVVVDKALDTAIAWIIGKAKALFAKLFGKGKQDDRTPEQKQADLDRAVNEAQALQDDPKIPDEQIRKRLAGIKKKYALTKLELIIDSDQEDQEVVHIEAEINPKKPTKQSSKSKGILFVSASGSRPPGRSTVGALPIVPTASARVFEQRAGQALEAATGQTAQTGMPLPTKLGAPVLLTQTPVGTVPGLSQIPDYLRLTKGKIEVFEITLDAKFEIGRPSAGSGVSHKRVQLAGTIHQLATQYPGVPIVYNIRSTKDAPEQVRTELEAELRSLRQHLAAQGLSNPIQIIWRYG